MKLPSCFYKKENEEIYDKIIKGWLEFSKNHEILFEKWLKNPICEEVTLEEFETLIRYEEFICEIKIQFKHNGFEHCLAYYIAEDSNYVKISLDLLSKPNKKSTRDALENTEILKSIIEELHAHKVKKEKSQFSWVYHANYTEGNSGFKLKELQQKIQEIAQQNHSIVIGFRNPPIDIFTITLYRFLQSHQK